MKYDRQTHAAAILLALLCAAGSAVGCSDAPDAQTSVVTDAVTTADTVVTEAVDNAYGRAGVRDNLPQTMDFGGQVVRVLSRSADYDTHIEFLAEESTGDVVQDAVYQRNLTVSDRLNLTMEVIEVDQTRHEDSGVNDLVRKSVTAGSDDYDLVGNHMSGITKQITNNYCTDLRTLDHIDFSQPWWNQSYIESVSIDGKTYMCSGELAQSIISGTYVLFFNKNLWATYFDDNLYDIVLDGTWTWDRLGEFCKGYYQDLNGDGTADENDRWGYVHQHNAVVSDAIAVSFDLTFTEYNESAGIYEWALENERTAAFLDTMKTFLHTHDSTFIMPSLPNGGDVEYREMFMNDHMLFMANMLSVTENLRDMESDYGILPLPKYEEAQEDYHTVPHNGFTVFAIPTTCSVTDVMGAFLEAMSAESYRTVTPAYYDTALKVKYARDDQAGAMLDLCTGGVSLDFAYLFNAYIGNSPASLFREVINTSSAIGKGMSTIAGKEAIFKKKIDALFEAYRDMD